MGRRLPSLKFYKDNKNMKRYTVSLFEITYNLISFENESEYKNWLREAGKSKPQHLIAVYPSPKDEAFLFARLENAVWAYEYYPVITIVAHFVFSTRGLPIKDFFLETPFGMTEVYNLGEEYFFRGEKEYAKIVKSEKEIYGCTLPCVNFFSDGEIEIYESEKIENCNLDFLTDARLLRSDKGLLSALVFENRDGCIRFFADKSCYKEKAPLYYASAILRALIADGRARFGVPNRFSYLNAHFSVSLTRDLKCEFLLPRRLLTNEG